MNFLLTDPSSDSPNRIFFLSALGSALLHACLLTVLSFFPHTPEQGKIVPTVQVKLLPALQAEDSAPPSPSKPLVPAQPNPSPPVPSSSQFPSSNPPPPLQASLKPLPSTPAPLPQTKPVIKDIRTEQKIKSRQMLKMAVPRQPGRTSLLSPTTPHWMKPPAKVPINPRKQPQQAQTPPPFPPPMNSTAHQVLKASPPASAGSSITSPRILSSSKPLYPRVARESGWEGTVIVRTLITPDGLPSQVEIRKSCGHEALDLAAQEAIKTWKFQPAKDGNIPIAKWVDIPVKFDLNS